MKTLEEGAKMLIVAWVKDWNMRTLMQILLDKTEMTDECIEQLVTHFPFMPSHKHWYISNHGCGINTQQFVAQAYPKLSNKLYELKSNEIRLKCSQYIAKQKIGEFAPKSKYTKEDMNDHINNTNRYKQEIVSYRESRATFKKHNRSAWEIVK